jgi:serine/threonine protein kinase
VKPLTDQALARLREAAALPDLSLTRYTLIRELGRGGMGAVYLAHDRELDRSVALKVLHVEDPSVRREARMLATLEHPNIIPIYDCGELPDGRFYYVMKFVEGPRLDEYLQRQDHPLPHRLRLFERICEAVAFAHSRSIIHRDLKPGNIMVGAFGEVLLVDWGLGKSASDPDPGGGVMGTPEYMAPEQARGESRIDERADIYALGRILEDLIRPDSPKALRSVCRKALSLHPKDRYPSALALSADVLRFLDGFPVSAHKETPVEALMRFCSRNRTLLLLLLAYVAARFLIFFWTRR